MKRILLVLTVIIVVSIPLVVFAATSDSKVAADIRGFCEFGGNTSNMMGGYRFRSGMMQGY